MKNIEELISARQEARENKDWKLSDEIRNQLDSLLVFIFDVKHEGKELQEVYYLNDEFFNKVFNYPEKKIVHDDEREEIVAAWKETRMEKVSRLHKVTFDTKRKFVEWNIQSDIKSDKTFDAWLFTINSKK